MPPFTRVLVLHRVLAFVGLVALATLSLFVGTHLRWYWAGTGISLGIAGVKTYLVLWFFMDMAEQPFRSRLAGAVAVLLLLTLVGLTAADVATRMLMPRGPSPQPAETFYER